MKSNEPDLSKYRESTYPGKKLIAVGVAIFGLVWLSGFAIDWNQAPELLKIGLLLFCIPAAFCYFIGFWKAVKGKGYPQVLWLASFTGIIGLIILMYLPDKSSEE